MSDFIVDCACLIHGDAYDWIYVEKLHSMLKRNFSHPVRLHVYTEQERTVPADMIKHVLRPWPGIGGPRQSWWYKLQLFDRRQFAGQLLYFDLDTVVTGNLDWILGLNTKYFWAIHDFKYLWRGTWNGINSSIMYWNTVEYNRLWKNFNNKNIDEVVRTYPGDQDYIGKHIDHSRIRHLNSDYIKSYRWQCKDGGMDWNTKRYLRPDAGTVLPPDTRVLIFHGNPKPHEVSDVHSWWR